MKATGIVRRIDDLGRVVIPKEIRRTLRIREGDPLEIFTDREGGVILKKYSPIGELTDFSKEDAFISVSGATKKDYFERKISSELEEIMDGRKASIITEEGKTIPLHNDEDQGEYTSQVIAPIITEGDAIGAVLIVSKETGEKFGDLQLKLAETAAAFLGKQMEQ